jgi:hypothetical protein
MGALIFFAIVLAALAAFAVLAVKYGADSRMRSIDPRGSLYSFGVN